jgi:hypothetical protein
LAFSAESGHFPSRDVLWAPADVRRRRGRISPLARENRPLSRRNLLHRRRSLPAGGPGLPHPGIWRFTNRLSEFILPKTPSHVEANRRRAHSNDGCAAMKKSDFPSRFKKTGGLVDWVSRWHLHYAGVARSLLLLSTLLVTSCSRRWLQLARMDFSGTTSRTKLQRHDISKLEGDRLTVASRCGSRRWRGAGSEPGQFKTRQMLPVQPARRFLPCQQPRLLAAIELLSGSDKGKDTILSRLPPLSAWPSLPEPGHGTVSLDWLARFADFANL